jgi:ligand-binding sensor domain-containing protein
MKNSLARIALIAILFVCCTQNVSAQWVATNGPSNFKVECLDAVSGQVVAGLMGGLFLTSDGGDSWVSVQSNLTSPYVQAIAISGTNVYIGTNAKGVYVSINAGPWTQINNGITNPSIFSFTVNGSDIYAGSDGSIYHTSDEGANWVHTNFTSTSIVHSLATNGSALFAATGVGVYRSTDKGNTWISANTGLGSGCGLPSVQALAVIVGEIVAGTSDGPYVSSNNGDTWTALNDGMKGKGVSALVSDGTNIYAGTVTSEVYYTKVFSSSGNFGGTWQSASNGLPKTRVNAMVVSAPLLLVGTDVNGVWKRPLSDFTSSGVGSHEVAANALQLSPNPTNGVVSVSNLPTGPMDITIVNLLGETLMEASPQHESALNLDLSKLPRGNYFARFVSPGSVVTRMIVRE